MDRENSYQPQDASSFGNLDQKGVNALVSVAQWIECWPANQRVTSLIPSLIPSTCLGCGPGPQWGVCKRQPHIDVSLPFFLPPFSSL